MGKLRDYFLSGLILSASLFYSASSLAQEESFDERDYKVRPVRLGVKIGFPNLIGGNLEYVTPLFNDKLAATVDYSTIKSNWILTEEETNGTEELNFSYLDFGINYYFSKPGKGFYGGVGYNNIKFEGNTSVEDDGRDGTGYLDFNHGSFNVKLGARLGGLFYFRPEIGYSFSPLPKSFDYTVEYDDGTTEEDTYDLSGALDSVDFLFKGLMANIGIGFAF